MSTDIPFGAHPPTGGAGAPPTNTTSNVMQASSYFGAPSGSSPTDANPFHFVGSTTGAPPSMLTQPPPSSLMVAPPMATVTGPPGASDFFAQSTNPNVSIFNPGAPPPQVQPTFPGDSFGVSPMTAVAPPPPQPSQTGNLFPATGTSGGAPFQSSGSSGADFFNAAAPPQTQAEVAPPPPTQGFYSGGQTMVTEVDEDRRQHGGFQRHSSAPALPGASSIFAPPNPGNQPENASNDFFSSFGSQQQQQPPQPLSSLQGASSQGEFPLQTSTNLSRDGRQQERPYSQEPPSPHQQSQPMATFGSLGSVSAPATTLHQVLPSQIDEEYQGTSTSEPQQQKFSQTGFTDSSGSPVSPFRPPSNADIHSVPPPGPAAADYQQMTNADCADSNPQLALNSSGMVPNQVQPGHVHPSLTEDLGMTNASHGSMANLRTNASTEADISAISAAIADATTPVEAIGPVQFLTNEESSGSSRERDSSLNLDSKSVSSLLEGSQDDFSHYSPIRLLPPAPLGGEQSQSPQTLSSSQQQQQQQHPSSSDVTLLPAAPQIGPGLETQAQSESREQLQFAVEHGHEKNASDDLKDWEIVDNVPPASEVSQLPSSVRLLPPSSFASITTGPVPTLSTSGTANSEAGGVSQAMQQLSLEPSRSHDVIQPHPPPASSTQGRGSHSTNAEVMSAGPSLPCPMTSGEKASPVAPLETNFTNLENPPPPTCTTSALQSHPPTTSVGYHRPGSGHSESHLSSNLPEPKEISTLITQIPFLTPVTSTTSLLPSQPTLLTHSTRQPPACGSSTSTAAPLGLHTISSTTTTSTASAVTLVPSLSSLQTGDHHHHHHHREKYQEHQHQPPFSVESSVQGGGGGALVTATAPGGGSTQQQFQTERGAPSSQIQVQPSVSAPVQPSGVLSQAGAQTGMDVLQPHTAGRGQQSVGTEISSMNAQSNLPTHSLPVAVTSAFEAPSATTTGQLPGAPSNIAVPSHPQMTTVPQASRPELAPPPLSSLPPQPQTTSAFVQVQQREQHGLVNASNLQGRPDLNAQPIQQIQPAMTQSHPGLSTGPPAPVPVTTPVAAALQHQGPPPPATGLVSQPATQPLFSSELHQQTTVESQQQTGPQLSQSHITSGVPAASTTTSSATSLYQEERGGGGGGMEPSQGPSHHHHPPPDDHGYYHDSYYPDRDRDSYYGDPRDSRYRAPSAFSEREADHHYRHGYHHPRPADARYDYSHYPDRYGAPNYGYDDPYHMGGGYYGPPVPRHGLRDEYGMPPQRTPYYDSYDPYGYHHPHAHPHHHQRPYDPRYGGHYPPPPSSRGPPYGSEYPPDPLYDPYHQPPTAYEHDPRMQQQSESGYDSHTYPPQPQPASYDYHEELNPAEASAIAGQTNNFEASQFIESPNTHLPNRPHPQEVQHNSTAYLDPQQQHYPGVDHLQHAEYAGEQHGYHHPGQGYVQVCLIVVLALHTCMLYVHVYTVHVDYMYMHMYMYMYKQYYCLHVTGVCTLIIVYIACKVGNKLYT